MKDQIRESDWKVFRKLRDVALERFCGRVLDGLQSIAVDGSKTNHERYLAIWDFVQDENENLAILFDNPRRSVAVEQLAYMQRRALLTDEEFSQFTEETTQIVRRMLDIGPA
jgi:hypothetical protein